jgi:hypothetical protein
VCNILDPELPILISAYETNILQARETWVPGPETARRLGAMTRRLNELVLELERRHPSEASSPIVAPTPGESSGIMLPAMFQRRGSA